jgi:hypothetical protein
MPLIFIAGFVVGVGIYKIAKGKVDVYFGR